MNILVFGEAAWDDRNSFGNTVSNLLCGEIWSQDNFSNFYAREQMPNNNMVNVNYYNISALKIVKGVLKLKIKGRAFSSEEVLRRPKDLNIVHTIERKRIDKLHTGKHEFIYYGHELIWRSKIWINRYFKAYIKENAPDILFAFATSPYVLWPITQYLKNHTTCKVVLLIADDVYGSYDSVSFYRKGYLKRGFAKCIEAADLLYGASDELSRHYAKGFGKPVHTLYKGCDLSQEPKRCLNGPLRFVYAGNLFWGRDDTLAEIAVILNKINAGSVKAVLEIYTGATITDETRKKLDIPGTSQIMGLRPYDEIKAIMHDADVVLHVESFEPHTIDYVRYSFSTKIIDCLQSGAQVLGIGPVGIASIEYLRNIDGVLIADEREKIGDTITQIIGDPDLIMKNVEKIRKYALEKHEKSVVQRKLRESFAALTRPESDK